MKQVVAQLSAGGEPGSINIPHGQMILKPLLCQWLAEALEELSSKPEQIKHLWEKTGILQAWDKERQFSAAARQGELFKTRFDAAFNSSSLDSDYQPTTADHEVAEEGVGASTVDLLHSVGAPVEELIVDATKAMEAEATGNESADSELETEEEDEHPAPPTHASRYGRERRAIDYRANPRDVRWG